MKKRFSKNYFFYHLFTDIFAMLFLALIFFIELVQDDNGDFQFINNILILVSIICVGFYIILVLYHYFYYRTSFYSLDEEGITCVKGVFFKKKSFLNYDKIHAVNKKQGLIQQLFKIGYLLIDSGSTMNAYSAEIIIIEDSKIIDELIEKIKNKQDELEKSTVNEDSSIDSLYHFDNKKKFIYSALVSLMTILVMSLVVLVYGITAIALLSFNLVTNNVLLNILIGFLIALVGLGLFSLLVSYLTIIFKYHKFKLSKSKDDITISYGLFVRNTNTFKIQKIKAIIIEQGFFERLFHFAVIKLEVIGYGENLSQQNGKNKVNDILIPLCHENDVESILNQILPEYKISPKTFRAKDVFSFISMKLLILSSIYALYNIAFTLFSLAYNNSKVALISFIITSGIYLLFIAYLIIGAFLGYSNEGISIDNDQITVYKGAFIKKIYLIKRENIIGIESITTYYRKKKRIYSYIIHFMSNSDSNTVLVSIQDKAIEDVLTSFMEK